MPRWLILVHRIPPRPLYLRAKMRQRLATAGAIAVKNSVYLLPQSAEAREDLEWIAQEIVAGGGDAHLFEGEFLDPAASAAAVAQFRQTRAAEYRELSQDARAAARRAGKRAGSPDLAPVHDRLTKRLQQVRRLDFFEAGGRAEAEQAVAAVASRLLRTQKQENRMRTANAGLKGRTWVTRPGVKVDRIASAWFIRRFIDPKARFRFEDPQAPRRANDLRFDMIGGDYTHEGDRCTLETLIGRVGLPDAGVRAIAEIVHDIDLKDSKFGRAETPGTAAAIDGLARRLAEDADRIEHGSALFDDLHQALGRGKKGAEVTRLLTRTDVASVLTLQDCIAAVEQAFHDYDTGRLAKSASLGIRADAGTFHVKAARSTVFAAKINANFPGNPAQNGLPTIQGLIVVMDLERGAPIAVLDSTLITTLRTAAATAMAAKHLARADAGTVAVIGCGAQGRASVLALREVRPLRQARLWDVDARELERCAAELVETGLEIRRAGSLESAVEAADIIVTCTPATDPYLESRHVRPGTFVAAVGADNPQKCEITPELMACASVVPDLLEQAVAMGDLRFAIASGRLTAGDVHGELGAVVSGRVPGRRTAEEIFIFDSTGTALQDVVVASLAVKRADDLGIGSLMSFAGDAA